MTRPALWYFWLATLWLPQPLSADGPELCVVGRLASSDISALHYQRAPSRGCFSRRVTPAGHEVHVIRLATRQAGRQGRSRVALTVRPPTDGSSYSRHIIVVLDASSAVDWFVEGRNGFQNGTSFQVIVTKRCRVLRCDLASCEVQSERVRGRDALLQFVMERLWAVTSYTEVSAADTIRLTVGIDLSAPDTCDTTTSTLRANAGLVPRRARAVTLDGCYHRHLARLGQRDVYVVEVVEESSDFRNSKITISLLPYVNRRLASGNLTLILKAAVPVTWQLTADGFTGNVLVLADSPVGSGALAASVSLEVERVQLPESFSELLILAVGYSSGPPVAYIRSPAISRLDLRLGGAPDEAVSEVQPASDAWGSRQHQPPELFPTQQQTADGAVSASGALRRAISVSCSAGQLVVAVPAAAADAVSVSALHLADWSCRSTRNGSHLVVSRPLTGCGTQRRLGRRRRVYANTVHFVTAEVPTDDEDFEGSGFGMTEDTVGTAAARWERPGGGSVPVSCAAPEHEAEPGSQRQDATLDISKVEASVYSLELSTDDHFSNAIKPNTLVPISHSIFVRFTVYMAAYLQPVVERCWASGAATPAPLTLLTAGCPAIHTVSLPGPGPTGAAQFSFQVTPELARLGRYYVHCSVGVCAAADSPARHHIAQCADASGPLCADGPADADVRLASGLQVITRGPLLSTFADELSSGPGRRRPVLQVGVSHEMVVAIGACAFLFGVALTGGVWLIHSKIGPSKPSEFQSVAQNPSLETVDPSANSTPSSQTPIIVAGRAPAAAAV
ncbi:transforming growth factor beta receptor type 3-like [Pollicipes pollicipes]|uniref:transforming growth factor beta receptor type 3-like n=1 Tax=Pollicipes pollicipes TaxID=41117 RepID=UPI0018855BD4|nr:transforming growth factor beta receptor type 3-like [Pollicipes pollicipes]